MSRLMASLNVLVLVLALFATISTSLVSPSDTHHADDGPSPDTYDFVIVGGGTAGAALATRLSQGLPEASIVLLEAGPSALDEIKINAPGLRGSTFGGPYDWNLTTVPQAGLNNRTIGQIRGKVLGGSSALNFMTWNRASVAEYDAWEELGSPGWNWDSFSESMKRSDNFSGINGPYYDSKGVGSDGPIKSSIDPDIPALPRGAFIPTMQNLGLSQNRESLGGMPQGVMYQPSNIDPTDYRRSYSANSYLPLAGANLEVRTETRVAKVKLKPEGNLQRATGVTLQDGTVISARKEVILSAGALQSPGLLELSGIGGKQVLDRVGIRQLVHLPGVGENLQDHVMVSSSFRLKPGYGTVDRLNYDPVYRAEQEALWRAGSHSAYAFVGGGIAFLDWDKVLPSDSRLRDLARQARGNSSNVVDRKKLELLADDSVSELEIIYSDGYLGLKGYPARNSSLYGESFLAVVGVLMHTLSRGSVHITSSDIAAKPAIDPHYLDTEHDVAAAVEVLKYVRTLSRTAPLADLLVDEYEPGLAETASDQQWRDWARNNARTVYHPAGTNAMLPRRDGGVVDPRLRVYGTANLRVVDVSVVPILIASHTQTAAYGIAEKAAAIIVEHHAGT